MKTLSRNFFAVIIVAIIALVQATPAFAISGGDTTVIQVFVKKEKISGFFLTGKDEREEILTDYSRSYDKVFRNTAVYSLGIRNWTYIAAKQEYLNLNAAIGPFISNGSSVDSSWWSEFDTDDSYFGVTTSAGFDYSNRYYYDEGNYTLVEAGGSAKYDIFSRNSEGVYQEHGESPSDSARGTTGARFRAGIFARAGAGLGRLTPMNHYMEAEYLLKKYYQGRLFSVAETERLASAIGLVKSSRKFRPLRKEEDETRQVAEFLRKKMLLSEPENLIEILKFGEFLPRFHGKRVEAGPFFNYYNREPDFIYGGFVSFENHTYSNFHFNRNFTATLSYNRYKKSDWFLLDTKLGWDYYINLKSRVGLGVKYAPSLVVNEFNDIGKVQHSLSPYISCSAQLSHLARLDFSFIYRFSGENEFYKEGPEFSLAFYRSK